MLSSDLQRTYFNAAWIRVGMGCLPCQLFPVAEKARKGSLSIFSVRSLEDLGEKSIFAARLTNRTLQNPKGAPLSVNLFWEGVRSN